jgi:hypothetical protein
MDTLGGHVATIVVALIVGYFSQFLLPRSKLIYWSPHNFFFDLRLNPNFVLQTNSLILQNVGRSTAEGVEVIHKQRPDFFELFPAMAFVEKMNPNGEHVITIANLGPKEWVLIQLLSYANAPVLKNIRSTRGPAKWVKIQPQRVYSHWVNWSAVILFVTGAGTLAYFLIRLGIYVARQCGYLNG